MNKLTGYLNQFIESVVTPMAGKVASQRHIMAIKDGFIGAVPFLIVGSCLLALAFPPFATDTQMGFAKAWMNFARQYQEQILMPFNMTMGIMTIFITFGIARSLASSYKMSTHSSSLLAVMSFLLVTAPMTDGQISAEFLGGTGIFTCILVSIYSVELQRFMYEKKLVIRLPEQVPAQIANSFATLTPILAILITLYPFSLLIHSTTGMLLPETIMSFFVPLVSASDSYLAMVFVVVLIHLLWFAGIHGASIVSGILAPFWLANITANQAAFTAGLALPAIYTTPFHAFYIVLGGSGATLLLPFLYMRSKAVHLKTIGKMSAAPGLFNINEPIIFGTPIVMNPIFFIPFVLGPVVNATIAYFAVKSGLVAATVSLVPWTTPGPFGAAWAANWALSPAILCILLAVNAVIMYYPFVKAYEKTLLEQERKTDSQQDTITYSNPQTV